MKKQNAPKYNLLDDIPWQISESEVMYMLQTKDVNWRYVHIIKELTQFTDDVISEWLNVSVKTFRTYKQPNIKFKENVKEHILLLISLLKHGMHVFGSSKNFDAWLNTSNFYFDDKNPALFLNTVSGIRFVNDRLTAMEFGDNV